MPTKRQILERFKRDELIEFLDRFELEVSDRRVRALLLETLSRSRRAPIGDILEQLKRDRLKELCVELGLDDSGRAKADLVERLLGKTSAAPTPKPPTRKKKESTSRPVTQDAARAARPASADGDQVPSSPAGPSYLQWFFGSQMPPDLAPPATHDTPEVRVPGKVLDAILSLQLTVAWVGDGRAKDHPKWWSDESRENGRSSSFGWRSLSTAREQAIQADRRGRYRMDHPQQVRTLYFWGQGINNKLDKRLAGHKLKQNDPRTALALPFDPERAYDRDEIEHILLGKVELIETRNVPDGRLVSHELPPSLLDQAQLLAAALVPLADTYPLPFFRLDD